jgi:hypothetical protein
MSFKLATCIAFDTLCMAISCEMIWSTTFITRLHSSVIFSIHATSSNSRSPKASTHSTTTRKCAAPWDIHSLLQVNNIYRGAHLPCYAQRRTVRLHVSYALAVITLFSFFTHKRSCGMERGKPEVRGCGHALDSWPGCLQL